MKKININTISRMYEILYKKFNENGKNTNENFYAVNNALIFCVFVKNLKLQYDFDNIFECQKIIEEECGTQVFFNTFKKTQEYKENLNYAISKFSFLLKDVIIDMHELEKVLGNVLEKHINRKATGSYYTPDDTTKYIAWNTIFLSLISKCGTNLQNHLKEYFDINSISELLNKKTDIKTLIELSISILNDAEIKELKNNLMNFKVIDPTCGSGAFIISAFECLEIIYTLLNGNNVNYESILENIYGLDISSEAIQLTKVRLVIKLASLNSKIHNFNHIFNNHFVIENALIGSDYVINEPGYDWKNFGDRFDCIIGNPPYIESKANTYSNFITNKCGNLYAHIIERSCNVVKQNGFISFIVPLSFVSTQRMEIARKYLENNSYAVYYSTYADRPGCIFSGVHQRLVIFFAQMGEGTSTNIYTSKYNYWYKEERENLFNSIEYYPNKFSGLLPKIGNETEEIIYSKLKKDNLSINSYITSDSKFPLYLSTRIGFWPKVFNQNRFSSKEYKTLYTKSEEEQMIILAILNSSTFYFYWVLSSDCWHLTNSTLNSFKVELSKLSNSERIKIIQLSKDLLEDLEKNKKYIGSKQTEYEYKHKYSKSIIDKIDDNIANIFGLSNIEVEYIKRYTEKYRTNKVEVN